MFRLKNKITNFGNDFDNEHSKNNSKTIINKNNLNKNPINEKPNNEKNIGLKSIYKNQKIFPLKLSLLVISIFLFISTIAFAIPNSLTLQGKLTTPAGASLHSTFNMLFRIYSVHNFSYYTETQNATYINSSGQLETKNINVTYINYTNILYEQNQSVTTDANGVYDVILSGINLTFADQYYLGIRVGTDNESTPRINLTSAPYSFRANISEDLNENNSYVVTNLSVTGNATIGTGGTTIEISTQGFNLTKIGNLNLANNLSVGGTTLFVDSFNQKFGIGLVNPQYLLQVANVSNAVNLSGIFYINGSNGNVGIGTEGPLTRFEVKGATATSGIIRISSNASSNIAGSQTLEFGTYVDTGFNTTAVLGDTSGADSALKIFALRGNLNLGANTGGAASTRMIINTNGGITIGGSDLASTTSLLYIDGTSDVVVDTSGNVGIGTTSPYNTLTVVGSAGISGTLNASSINTTGSAYFATSGAGNVGINTTTPAQTLQVLGTLNVTSQNTRSGDLFVASSGNVGIGTTSPGASLEIQNTSNGGPRLRFTVPDGSRNNWQMGVQVNNANAFEITPSTAGGGTIFSTAAIIINGSGYVGIGGAANRLLEVRGGTTGSELQAARFTHVGSNVWDNVSIEFLPAGNVLSVPAKIMAIPPGASDVELAFYTVNGGTAGERLRINDIGNVGIGTTSPSEKLTVIGNASFSGNVTINNKVNISADTGDISTAGNFKIGGGLNISGTTNISGNLYVTGNTVLGDSTSDTVEVNAQIASHLVPNTNARDLGSPSNFWRTAYIDFATINNLSVGDANISGTSFPSFTIGSNYSGDDARDVSLVFERGTPVLNAVLTWDSTNKRFDLNFPLNIQANNNLTVDTNTLFVDGSVDRVGIGTVSPNDKLEVIGNVRVSGSLNATNINASRFYARNGTAALPSYTFIEDIDTGLRLGGTNNISIVTGGSDRVTVDSSGNVGIGTTTPNYVLDVWNTNSGAETVPINLRNNANPANTAVALGFTAVANNIITGKISNVFTGSNDAYDLAFYSYATGLSERMRVTERGVGINLTVPNETIAIRGTLSVTSGSGTQGLFQNSAGNVGIGTTNPAQTLTVQGTLNVSGNATGRGDLFVSSLGRVGIGNISNPTAVLHIVKDGVASPTSAGVSDGHIWVGSATDLNKRLGIGYDTTSNYAWIQAVEQGVAFRELKINPQGSSAGVTIGNLGSGLLGIGGTNRASHALDINTSVGIRIGVNDSNRAVAISINNFGDTNAISFNNPKTGGREYGIVSTDDSSSAVLGGGGRFTFFDYTANAARMAIGSSGNFGIGTTSPSQKLELAGNMLINNTANAFLNLSGPILRKSGEDIVISD